MKPTDTMLPIAPMLPQQYTADVDYSQIPVKPPKTKAKTKAVRKVQQDDRPHRPVMHDQQEDVVVQDPADEPKVVQIHVPAAAGGAYVPRHYVVPAEVQVDNTAVGGGGAAFGLGWGGTLLALGLGGMAYYAYDQYQKRHDHSSTSNSASHSTTPYTTDPTLQAARFDGDKITLDFDQNLDATRLPKNTDFKIMVDGQAVDVNHVSVNGKHMILQMTKTIPIGSAVTLNYTDPTGGDDANAIQNTDGHDLGNLSDISVWPYSATDTTGPVLQSGKIDGAKLTLTFDENLDFNHLPDLSAFTSTQGAKVTGISGSGKDLVLSFDKTIDTKQNFKLSYVDPSANNDIHAVQDVYGNDSGNFNYNYTYKPEAPYADTHMPVL